MESTADSVDYEVLALLDAEFPHGDPRYAMREYRHCFMLLQDRSKPYDSTRGGPIQNLFWNSLVHLDVSTGRSETWFAGETSSVQEPVFVPRSASAAEGDGYVMALINRRDRGRNDLAVFDSRHLDQGPLATIHIPMRLRSGLHGNWVSAQEVPPA